MRYPVGTILKSHSPLNWYGEVIGIKNGKYLITWSDAVFSGPTLYNERELRRLVRDGDMTWVLPFTQHLPEELFTI